ncbi:acyl-ACP--UDP-N-acetylglucosamine O-acyltransferase [bacterium]|nr:acyl-ACP--UDP-N-acetylglucosamine O-acyltransferase [bacterium]
MPAEIHAAAHVGKSVVLGDGTRVGPGAVIEDGVSVGKGNVIWPNAFIGRGTTLGDENQVHPGAVVGHSPQDLAYDPSRETYLRVGHRNTFRETCTIHRATKPGNATLIGDGCYFMAGSHVAHDCKIGNKVILVNFAGVTGHCEVHDGAIMSGHTGIHQFCRIGKYTILSALSTINKDLPPFMIFGGRPACAQGVNAIGLRRAGISRQARAEIKRAYRAIYREGRTLQDAIEVIAKECPGEECRYLVDFLRTSKRGIAAGAAEQFETLRPHYNRGAQRRGSGEEPSSPRDDDDEVPADEIL